ncbi:hypothetical protein ABEB36_011434 [Hypothenemus hampei]|uniref:Uncharacterized protein n=1 Tax=Hypothenemus hampei TaxID=57062 RepID=A0ABD1EFE8_HYPHA
MFGNKLRAWMEAVRPKKKQHRKEKQTKILATAKDKANTSTHTVTWKTSCLLNSEKKELNQPLGKYGKAAEPPVSGYSANNLSSPESAYSTGYSTDGTSPGLPPPEYLIHSSAKNATTVLNRLNVEPARNVLEDKEPSKTPVFFGKLPEPAGLISPRQRNRIRTNPWLPGGSSSNVASPVPVRQEPKVTPMVFRKTKNSPIQHRYLSPATHRRSLSSSSCSSISAGANYSFEHRVLKSLSDEDDCTLNEMMGKYDESYIYEKETDILSDSDPTDCESDIDTGQDGGDEEDNGEEELDFIDNGSYVEVDNKADNTGHCMYFVPMDMQRQRSSRRRTTRRAKETSERRKSKKTQKHPTIRQLSSHQQEGSKSAGATPVSIRKSGNIKSTQHKIQEEFYKRRSHSVCLQRDANVLIEKRDREADMKYKELIGQAEQIIKTMNVNGLSPRRLPGPTNKRVELLKFAECAKAEVLFMGKPTDEVPILNSNLPPSTVTFKNTRFSPKKNHITNFIINNSPVSIRKELQGQTNIFPHLPMRRHDSPIPPSKPSPEVGFNNSPLRRGNIKGILHKNEPSSVMLSPRHRRESECPLASSSSEDEGLPKLKKKLLKGCPQSEPMRRKVYFSKTHAVRKI